MAWSASFGLAERLDAPLHEPVDDDVAVSDSESPVQAALDDEEGRQTRVVVLQGVENVREVAADPLVEQLGHGDVRVDAHGQTSFARARALSACSMIMRSMVGAGSPSCL